MKSMTGYGLAVINNEKWSIEVSMKAVNGRFLDLRFRLPKEYMSLENDLKKKLQAKHFRGSFDIYINRKIKDESQYTKISVDSDIAKKWAQSYKKLAKELKIEADLKMETLIKNLPQSLKISESKSIKSGEKKDLILVFQQAITSLEKEKAREGLALKKELLRLLKELLEEVSKIEGFRKKANLLLKEKLSNKLKVLDATVNVSEERLHQEVLLQVDKSDIDEEVVRLKEHIRSLKPIFETKGSLGKKLDFYSQELLREMNTIGSKSQLAELTAVVVNAKSITERFREQVQNIE